MSRGTAAPLRALVALVVLTVGLLALPLAAAAQGGRNMTLNLVEARAWPDVTVNLSLTGPDGKAVPDLQPAQFEVREQGQTQQVTGLGVGPAHNVPLQLVLAIDVSGSMGAGGKLQEAKNAARAFLGTLKPEDVVSVVAFNDTVQVVIPETADKAAAGAGIESLQPGGNTAVYDALHESVARLSAVAPGKRRAVILLTDGADTSSRYSARVSAELARQTGALVYAIGLGADAVDSVLKLISEPTGGKYYKAPSPADLGGIYTAIGVELDSQVFITYHSTARVERSYQVVVIELTYKAPDGQVITRAISYRPPASAVIPREDSTGSVVVADVTPVVGLPAAVVASPATPKALEMGFFVRAVSVLAALLVGLAVFVFLLALLAFTAPSATRQRLYSYVGGPVANEPIERGPSFYARVVLPSLEGFGQRLERLSPRGYTDHIESLLTLMGPPYRLRLPQFIGLQLVLSVTATALLLFWALQTSPDAPSQWVLAVVLGLAIGFYLPYFWLKRRVTRRRRGLLKALPGALDFLAINVEAGLGFDSALTQVVNRWRNTLTDEFALLLIDFQIGKPRKDAWRDLVQRTQLPELSTFVTAMLQNEQLGASIGLLLRTQAEQMRVRRRQNAEEAARTAPVKMLLPMVFFIFPGIFVVILGPAVPQFIGTFFQMGR